MAPRKKTDEKARPKRGAPRGGTQKTASAKDRAKIKADHAEKEKAFATEPVFDPEIANIILERLADGETLNEICRTPGMPKPRTVRRWSLNNEEFAPLYARARELGYMAMADDLIEVASDGRNDWMARQMAGADDDDPSKVAWQVNGEHVSRSRLRVDTMKWTLSKALPRIYGDKLALTDADGGTFKVQFVA